MVAPYVLDIQRAQPLWAATWWLSALVVRALAGVATALFVVFELPATALFQAITHWCWHTVLPVVTAHLGLSGHSVGDVAALAPSLVLAVSVLSMGVAMVRATRAVRRLVARALAEGPRKSLIVGGSDVLVAAAGLSRPKVVVSAGALAVLDDEELAASLDHERGHIVRGHRWLLFVAQCLEALGRLIPGTRRAFRELVFHLERDADRWSIDHDNDPLALASAICKAAAHRPTSTALAALGGSAATRRVDGPANRRNAALPWRGFVPMPASSVLADPLGPVAPPVAGRGARRRLYALVFVVGAASLGAEIAAARLIAPYFGASTIVWANTIAVVLVGLSVGYWVGGRLADRHPTLDALAWLTLAAAGLLALVPLVSRPFLGLSIDALDSLSAGAFLGSLAAVVGLVAVPVALLGAASPWAVRISVASLEAAGTVTGRLYAVSTAGSLCGVFLAALALVPLAGTRRTFMAFALALALAAATLLPRRALLAPAAIALALAWPPGSVKATTTSGARLIYEQETPYQYARVIEQSDGERLLELDEGQAVHSLYRPGSVLTDNYWDAFLVLPLAVRQRPARSLAILGGGAGTTARAYAALLPRTRIDLVEIDKALTHIGRRFFALRPGPRLRLITSDARPFLRENDTRYEAIFLDAYRQPYIPFYLATREFFALVDGRLDDDGVLVINVGHLPGSDDLERAITATLRTVFPAVARVPVTQVNTMVVAARTEIESRRLRDAARRLARPLRALAADAARRLQPALRGGPVWTDDRAPVEWLVDRSIVRYAAGARNVWP